MIQETTHEAAPSSPRPSVEEIRAELYRMLDELATSRSINSAKLSQRFGELWSQIGPDAEPTLH